MDEVTAAVVRGWLDDWAQKTPTHGETDRERIIRELQDAALYAVYTSDGTHWYLDVEDAIAIVRGERHDPL